MPVGPQLLVGGPSGILDIVLRGLWAFRPFDARTDVSDHTRVVYMIYIYDFDAWMCVNIVLGGKLTDQCEANSRPPP